jgi:hypothetical protein
MVNFVGQIQQMPSSSAGMNDFWIRAILFLMVTLLFVTLCGLAWRYIPALRNLVNYQPKVAPPASHVNEDDYDKPLDLASAPVTFAKPVSLSQSDEGLVAPTDVKPNPRPLPSEFLQDYLARGEGGAVHNDIQAAIADGRPGTVVRAASDLNGVASNSPIVIVHRED